MRMHRSIRFVTIAVFAGACKALSVSAAPVTGFWKTTGTWNGSANPTVWVNSVVPQNPGDTATFNNAFTTSPTATVLGTQIIGHLIFTSVDGALISPAAGSPTITINNTATGATGVPSINSNFGRNTVTVPVVINNGVTITIADETDLQILGGISGLGTLNKNGLGGIELASEKVNSVAISVNAGNVTIDVPQVAGTGFTGATVGTVAIHSNAVFQLAETSPLNTFGHKTVLIAAGLAFDGSSGAGYGGILDLANNDMIVHNGVAADLFAQIKSGANFGGAQSWVGTGIGSSDAFADPTGLHAIGYIVNDNNGQPIFTSFDNQSVVASDVFVKYTFFGDADLSGNITANDYTLIDNGFSTHSTGWQNGDFNYDGKVDGSDYSLIDNAFNTQPASNAAMEAVSVAETAVPEPTSIGLILAGLLSIRWKKSKAKPLKRTSGQICHFLPAVLHLLHAPTLYTRGDGGPVFIRIGSATQAGYDRVGTRPLWDVYPLGFVFSSRGQVEWKSLWWCRRMADARCENSGG